MSMAVSPDSVFESSIRRNFRRMALNENDDVDIEDPFAMHDGSVEPRRRSHSPRRVERESVDSAGNTSLIQAVIGGSKAAVERCLARGSAVDAQNFQGQTALFVACAAQRADIAEALLRRSADPNIAALDGSTPLHAASAIDSDRIVALLLDHGAFANARDEEGDAPLHWAAREGSRRAAALLLRRGADPALSNEDGETALDVDPSVVLFGSLPKVVPGESSPAPSPRSPTVLPSSPYFRGTPAGVMSQPGSQQSASLFGSGQSLPSGLFGGLSAPGSLLSKSIQQQQQQPIVQQSQSQMVMGGFVPSSMPTQLPPTKSSYF